MESSDASQTFRPATIHWGFSHGWLALDAHDVLASKTIEEHERILIVINTSFLFIKYSLKIDALLWEP